MPFAPSRPIISTLPIATLNRVLEGASAGSPILLAIFDGAGARYLNASGREWLDAAGQSDLSAFELEDILGLESIQLWRSEILPKARLLGKWSGQCDIRDVWGSEREALLTVTTHTDPEDPKRQLICMQAAPLDGAGRGEASVGDRELLHALLESATDSIYFKDKHSRMLRVSRSMAQKFAIPDPEDMVGRTDFDYFTSAHALPAYEDEQRIMRTGVPIVDVEEKETWPDGSVSWVSTTKMPLRDRGGETVGTFGISRDISARKMAESQARELETQLQLSHKLESIGRLAAGVAHEINTPSQFIADNTHFLLGAFEQIKQAIETYRTLLADASPESAAAARAAEQAAELPYLLEEIPKTLDQTLAGVKHVGRIVGSLKEFSHPGNSESAPADLNRAIENAIVVTRYTWKNFAEFKTDLDPDLPPVPCILDAFNQVMLNLIVNATHAIESAQKAGAAAPGTISVRTHLDEENFVCIEIEDTGSGIPEEIRQRVFEPFFTTKPVGEGTGQGLSFAHAVVVKRHHGTIDFVSEPGRGTTFRVRLPLSPST